MANDCLKGFITKMQDYKAQLQEFEKDRCEQVHSSINQFVVFEKFAEMNNKYDVTNFSKLIDTFDLDKEVQVMQEDIDEQVKYMRVNHSAEMG